MLRQLRWALLWALLILVLCLMPGAALPAWDWADVLSVDKLVHAGLFAVLGVLLFIGISRHYRARELRSATVLAVILVGIAYGGGLELMQMLSALGRRGDWNDFIANATGMGLAWGWYRWRWAGQRQAPDTVDA
ncbi:MAG: VanZ family protein [Flavobacteriales bacterium]|nr:VanZ family protein [Flavobacteriales bacterium]